MMFCVAGLLKIEDNMVDIWDASGMAAAGPCDGSAPLEDESPAAPSDEADADPTALATVPIKLDKIEDRGLAAEAALAAAGVADGAELEAVVCEVAATTGRAKSAPRIAVLTGVGSFAVSERIVDSMRGFVSSVVGTPLYTTATTAK